MKDSPTRQRYGDLWGKTVVVKSSRFSHVPPPDTWKVVAGVMVGCLVLMLCQFAGLLIKLF
jgi:hypothetical protein